MPIPASPTEEIRTSPRPAGRRAWEPPQVQDLPRLTELTLQTGPLIEGTCTPGSTCF